MLMAIPMSTSTSNSAFSIETTSINPILNGLDPDIVETLICGKEWSENPVRITSNGDTEHSPELTHPSFVLAGASLSLETQEKHAPSSANMELMLTKHRVNMLPLVPMWNSWLQILVQLRVLSQVQLVILHLFQRGLFQARNFMRNMLPLVPTWNSCLQILVEFHVLSHFELIILHLF
ncbi:uncharacterized protein LOC112018364 isoform X2 [Quercus suber]|uniref:uncharacterized protein LOC112018364 isoform X2 n=1 Tax=Quercus suber TaxID=58331 RepID=UPI0032DE3F9E